MSKKVQKLNSFSILSNTLHLWSASLLISDKKEQEYRTILADYELVKADKFHFIKDRKAYIASRGLLRILSGKYLKSKPESVEFKYSEYGKPSYLVATNLNFNLSHSGGRMLVGFVEDLKIGVDIELVRTNFDVLEIAANYFSKKENEALNKIRSDEKEKAFFRCWTRKEAFVKAEGSGLSFPLDKFSVSLDKDNEAILLETKWDSNEKHKWGLFSLAPYKQYLAAVAIKGKIDDYIIKEWSH